MSESNTYYAPFYRGDTPEAFKARAEEVAGKRFGRGTEEFYNLALEVADAMLFAHKRFCEWHGEQHDLWVAKQFQVEDEPDTLLFAEQSAAFHLACSSHKG